MSHGLCNTGITFNVDREGFFVFFLFSSKGRGGRPKCLKKTLKFSGPNTVDLTQKIKLNYLISLYSDDFLGGNGRQVYFCLIISLLG